MTEYSCLLNNAQKTIFINFETLEYHEKLYSGAVTLEYDLERSYLTIAYRDSWIRVNQNLDLSLGEIDKYLRTDSKIFREIVEFVTKQCMLFFYRTNLKTSLEGLV